MSEGLHAITTIWGGHRFRSRLEARWAVFFDAIGIKYQYEIEGYVLEDGSCYLPDFYLPDFKCYFEVKRGNILEGGCDGHEFDASEDGKKFRQFVEEVYYKGYDNDPIVDYVILASGDPVDALNHNDLTCGLVYCGHAKHVTYNRDDSGKTVAPEIKEIGGVNHIPVTFDQICAVYDDDNDKEFVILSKRSYEDLSATEGKSEIIPSGVNCSSWFMLANSICPRKYGRALIPNIEKVKFFAFAIPGVENKIVQAAAKARQARFEHGEQPEVVNA